MSAKSERAIAYQLIRDAHGRSWWSTWPWILFASLTGAWECLRPINTRWKVEILPVGGDCLRPWLKDGDAVMFSRELEARPGDLVVHSTPVEIRAGLGQRGRTLELLGAKQLKVDGRGRRWLTCADGAYKADPEHTILGPVVAVARRPLFSWRRRVPLEAVNFPIVQPVT